MLNEGEKLWYQPEAHLLIRTAVAFFAVRVVRDFPRVFASCALRLGPMPIKLRRFAIHRNIFYFAAVLA